MKTLNELASANFMPEDIAKIRKEALITSCLILAEKIFGSKKKANKWLKKPNQALGNKSPLDVLESDPKSVKNLLGRIDFGIIS